MTAATTRRPRRSRYSEAEQAERAAHDAHVSAVADQVLTDPAAVAQLIRQLGGSCTSPRVLRYSLRNQILVHTQARDRGIALVDVDSVRGWRQRGRGVRRGERGLRIVAPMGTDAAADTPEGAEAQPADPVAESTGRPLFRMVSVFDISQTDGADNAADNAAGNAGGPEELTGHAATTADVGAAAQLPGDIHHTALTEEITRREYRIVWSVRDPADPVTPLDVRVDHTARIVDLPHELLLGPDTDRAAGLSVGMAQILTHRPTATGAGAR